MKEIPAVVLCGGLGTRLRSVLAEVPKVLAPVGGVPFLGHLLRYLQQQKVQEVILSTGYLGEQVEAFVREHTPGGMSVRCVREPEPLGTGGALRFTRDTANLNTPFFTLNGDTFFTGHLPVLLDTHRHKNALATLALVHVAQADRYGTVEMEQNGEVTGFHEKEAGLGAAWINAGAYVLSAEALDLIPPGIPVSLERDIFPQLLATHQLYARPFPDAHFLDIGIPDDFARAGIFVESREGSIQA